MNQSILKTLKTTHRKSNILVCQTKLNPLGESWKIFKHSKKIQTIKMGKEEARDVLENVQIPLSKRNATRCPEDVSKGRREQRRPDERVLYSGDM